MMELRHKAGMTLIFLAMAICAMMPIMLGLAIFGIIGKILLVKAMVLILCSFIAVLLAWMVVAL